MLVTRVIAGLGVALLISCAGPPGVLIQLAEARRQVSEMRVQFSHAAETGNRAVMASAERPASEAANESRQATEAVATALASLKTTLVALDYVDELRSLEAFEASFQEYRKLDDELLPLTVENTNVKAQSLSFGAARDAASDFKSSLETAADYSTPAGRCDVESMVTAAYAALLEIRVLHAPHIAEADDAEMTQMENQISALEEKARRTVERLPPLLTSGSAKPLADASAALERFVTVNREIVTLSRRNSNVRSLALALGRRRTVTATGEDQLRALDEALSRHEFRATR